jgi:hypothetical protein
MVPVLTLQINPVRTRGYIPAGHDHQVLTRVTIEGAPHMSYPPQPISCTYG